MYLKRKPQASDNLLLPSYQRFLCSDVSAQEEAHGIFADGRG